MTNILNEQDEFVRLLEESYNYKFSVADVVKGIVIKQENDGFLVDIGLSGSGSAGLVRLPKA